MFYFANREMQMKSARSDVIQHAENQQKSKSFDSKFRKYVWEQKDIGVFLETMWKHC